MQEATLSRRAVRLSATPLPAEHEGVISFDSGHAFPGILPDLTQAAERALTTYRAETLQYAPRAGLPALREWISAYMQEDGADVSPDEVLVVNGAKHGLDLICRLLTDEGDFIVVTAPTYFTAIPIFRSYGLNFIEIGQDDEGLDVTALSERLSERRRQGLKPPKFIYDIPDFHNPTGANTSRRRREALIAVAAAAEIPIIEDSPYRKVRFEGDSEPSFKALDRDGIVFTLGTFSKLMAPGLRIGWISGAQAMLARMAQLKSDGGTCPLTQRIIVEFCKEGGLSPHLERVRKTYGSHRDHMEAALRRELPDVAFAEPQGGYYLWLRFPAETDTDVVAGRAREAGVAVIAGSKFFAGGEASYPKNQGSPKNYMRLAYSHAAPAEIDEGVRRLAASYRSMR
ncbi:MAG: PLP-dependent aminotransferase family protein [Acidobacteriaceae bacterium]